MQLSTNSQHEATPPSAMPGPEQRQKKRLILALICLLGAIAVVVIKNRNYLEPAALVAETREPTQLPEPENSASPLPDPSTGANSSRNATPKVPHPRKKTASNLKETKAGNTEAETYTPSVTRRALPPLDVEVFAGGKPVPLQPRAPVSIRVDTSNGTEGKAVSSSSAGAVGSAEKVRISPEALQVLAHPVDPNYPMLAREMKVQGAVVLDALIGRDGTIQNLKVVSGPTILANAAMEAVRQWRFKPYYQDGAAVETAARITVNFTISTT